MLENSIPVNNLLIDLGAVLYEIDVPKTEKAYRSLLPDHFKEIDSKSLMKHPLFLQLDQGRIEIDDFATSLIETFEMKADPRQIKQVWRELLVGLYPGRTELVQKLGERYRLALLSNTSRYHFEHYEEACGPMFAAMDSLFFSFEMGMTKPNPEIYLHVLQQMNWKAGETLFLDDSPSNIDAAKELGLQVVWIEEAEMFETLAQRLIQAQAV